MTMGKVMRYGKSVASSAKNRLKKELKAVICAGRMSRKDSKKFVDSVLNELSAEKTRVFSFAKKEFRREFSKARKQARPVVKKILTRYMQAKKRV